MQDQNIVQELQPSLVNSIRVLHHCETLSNEIAFRREWSLFRVVLDGGLAYEDPRYQG